jgi:hypothetical protein
MHGCYAVNAAPEWGFGGSVGHGCRTSTDGFGFDRAVPA